MRMMKQKLDWAKWVTEAQGLIQSGLAYSKDEYDKIRFERLREMIAEVAAVCIDGTLEDVNHIFSLEKGYATPKIDVRAFVMKDNQLLLVRERSDGLWSLPGGWADVNESPSESIVREVQEESGFTVAAKRLLALWDITRHDHPIQWPYIYKCVFECELLSGDAQENLEISDIDFFHLNQLPDLSTPRVTKKQIMTLYGLVKEANRHTIFD